MKTVQKKTVKKTVVKESVGRDLVGASGFASRSKVIDMIVQKYPTPQELSVALKQLAANNENEKVQKKILEIAAKCETLSPMQYPAFVKKIAGLNKLWGIAGKTVGAAAILAGVAWVASAFYKAGMDQLDRNKVEADIDKSVGDVNAHNEKVLEKQPILKKTAGEFMKKAGITETGRPVNTDPKVGKYFGKISLKPTEKNPVNIAHEKLTNIQKLKNVAGDAKESLGKDVSKAVDATRKVAKKLDVKPSEAAEKIKNTVQNAKKSVMSNEKVKDIMNWYKKQRG